MNELHDCRKLVMMRSLIAARLSRQDEQGGAQSFAPAGYEVVGYLSDQYDFRTQAAANDRIDLLQVVSNKAIDEFRIQLREMRGERQNERW